MASTSEAVRYERVGTDGSIALMTISEPASRNALSRAVLKGLWECFTRFEEDDEVRVGILTGEGTAFCAGIHLKEMAEFKVGPIDRNHTPQPGRNIFLTKPMIAAVNGPAYGGGMMLVQCCDLAVASEQATFAAPEVKWSRGAPWSIPMRDQIPQKIWFELLILGDPMSAQRAYEVGFVNRVVPAEQLMETAMDIGERILAAAPLTVYATKRMVDLAPEMGRWAAWDVAWEIFRPVYSSQDALEGPRSYAENRPATWQGR